MPFMRVVKIALSVIALLVGAVCSAMTAGMFNLPPTLIGVITAGGALFGYFGISPIVLSAAVSKILGGAFMFLTALVGWHASVVTAAQNPHPWLWHLVGVVAIIAGVLSRGPLNPSPPAAKPPA
jgi:hypothetical protein